MMMDPIPADVLTARRSLAGIAVRSPLVPSEISRIVGETVLAKLEICQLTGAFKLRGAAAAMTRLSPDELALGVGCFSTWNHGRAVAFVARHLKTPATVFLSRLVPEGKVAAIERLGATLERVGDSQDEAAARAASQTASGRIVLIPPFDDRWIIAGQGTVGLELMEDCPDLTTILVPVSGGGLASGVALAVKAIKPSVRIVGISMERGAAMAASLAAGQPVAVSETASLADNLGGGIGLDNR
jgi:threonine dehydratase